MRDDAKNPQFLEFQHASPKAMYYARAAPSSFLPGSCAAVLGHATGMSQIIIHLQAERTYAYVRLDLSVLRGTVVAPSVCEQSNQAPLALPTREAKKVFASSW